MTSFIPKNEEVLMWDPESMDKYWQQCEIFDQYLLSSEEEKDQQSQQSFQIMLLNRGNDSFSKYALINNCPNLNAYPDLNISSNKNRD